jgi:hypothetical protein
MSSTTIVIMPRANGAGLTLVSMHELYEQSGKNICTQDGLVALEGRSADEVRKQWTGSYRLFRAQWACIRLLLHACELSVAQNEGDTSSFEFVPLHTATTTD